MSLGTPPRGVAQVGHVERHDQPGELGPDGDKVLGKPGGESDVILEDETDAPIADASATASGECASGMPYLLMMISVSTPGASMVPRTAPTRPIAPRVAVGQRVNSTVTISPG